MPVNVKAILAAAEPQPVFGEDVMALSRIAQSNRTYARAQQLREKQEYDTFAIAQGAEVAGSVNFMDSVADIDLSISELSKMASANKGNKLVQASLTTLRGGLEETKQLASGRNASIDSLDTLSDNVYQLHEDRAKGGIYNEGAVTDLIKNAKNFVNSNAHYLDTALRTDYESKIDELVKTRNVYNMIDFYDKDHKERGIQFQPDASQPDHLTSIQQGLLQQSKNFADVGNVNDAMKSISSLAAVGVSEAKYTQRAGQAQFAGDQVADYRSQIESTNREVQSVQGFLGKGVEAGAELPLNEDFKEAVGGFKIDLPSDPNALFGSGGLETVNLAIRQQSDMLNEILKIPAKGTGLFNSATLDNITIDDVDGQQFGLDSGSTLKDVWDKYQSVVTDEEKEPYMDLMAHYISDPKYTQELASGFHGGTFMSPMVSDKEKNAARVMMGSARAYNKLKRLRKEHFIDFPISTSVGVLSQSGYGQQGGGLQMNWPGQQQP